MSVHELMKSLSVALSLIRVPKLFVSLLLWPLVIGLIVASFQIVVSIAFFNLVTETPKDYEKRLTSEQGDTKYIRKLMFGSSRKLPPIRICRWLENNGVELPPDNTCEVQPNEVAIHTASPLDYDVTNFERYFNGSTTKIHICKTCKADIVVEIEGEEVKSNVYGLLPLGVYFLNDTPGYSDASSDYIAARVDARKKLQELMDLTGTVYLHPSGNNHTINITDASKMMLLILNTAMLAVVTLWLSLKGHRKVLDYFASNGALLPLVAACGKSTFYTSLWIITLVRVAFFLIAVLPSTILVSAQSIPDETLRLFIGEVPEFVLWLLGLLASLSSLAIVASIAELKHRHSFVSFLYRYIPLLLATVGTVVWTICIFTPGETSQYLQLIIASLPVVGVSPIIVSPLLPVSNTVIAAHCLCSSAFVLLVLHLNSQWFAAHLEEI
jgi:hypothetical protein